MAAVTSSTFPRLRGEPLGQATPLTPLRSGASTAGRSLCAKELQPGIRVMVIEPGAVALITWFEDRYTKDGSAAIATKVMTKGVVDEDPLNAFAQESAAGETTSDPESAST
jgi:hypothetical protein